nr:PREDICTED: zinc-binding protein A33-like [Latimeria chalumnae]|eukprot:XP_014345240.1 PREDICTED: zinc-binding protein A33-like [Latimeria chalumnae]
MRPNLALANIVESFKKLDLNVEASGKSRKEKSGEKDEFYCEQHEERLKLFCEVDQKLICVICSMSASHTSHKFKPVPEAFQTYKGKLEKSLRGLQSQLKEAYRCGEEGEKETKTLQEKASYLKKQIRENFSKLHDFLYKEEEKLKEKLERKEMEILQQLEENRVKTAQEISKLEHSISEIQKRLDSQTAEEFLKDIKTVLTGTNVKFEEPERINADLCEEEFIGLLPYRMWKKMRDITDCPVLDCITINPRTAHPRLVVSEDGTSLQFSSEQQDVPDNPQCFTLDPIALGSEGFTSGRHYWEVEVGDKCCWGLGVVRESVERKTRIETSPAKGYYLLYKIWNYYVYSPQWTDLSLTVKPRRIGVYLDYEGGQVSFYNTENMSHVYTHTDTFTEKMYPYFNIWWNNYGENPDPLKLITPNN